MSSVKAGIVGCGTISGRYFEAGQKFPIFDVVACADLYIDRAEEKAREFDVPHFCSVEELLASPEIDIIINLTIPAAHAEVGLAALESGKSVYNEKPLAVTREDGRRMGALAKEKSNWQN